MINIHLKSIPIAWMKNASYIFVRQSHIDVSCLYGSDLQSIQYARHLQDRFGPLIDLLYEFLRWFKK